MKGKTIRVLSGLAVVLLYVVQLSCSTTPFSQPMSQSQIEEQRVSVRDMASQTLSQVYGQYPETRSRVQKGAGYAVFSDFGMKFPFMGSGTGHGIVINNATRQETFMNMVELQPGFGFGAQQFKVIFVFDTQGVLNTFVNSGWEFGSSAAAAGIPTKRELFYRINYLCVGYNGGDARDESLHLLVGDLPLFFEFDRSIPILLKQFCGDIDICFFERLYYGFSRNAAKNKGGNKNAGINYNSISSSRKLFSL